MKLEQLTDEVVMLTWCEWNSRPRSNHYHYASRFAKQVPVLFVQPNQTRKSRVGSWKPLRHPDWRSCTYQLPTSILRKCLCVAPWPGNGFASRFTQSTMYILQILCAWRIRPESCCSFGYITSRRARIFRIPMGSSVFCGPGSQSTDGELCVH